ncbi:hypothetical protein TGVEG_439900 [Toxoplasma gondii VEG]|uniref:Uncharacterized protein n=1 Tax=Toxoplasma gondii (strain ATCC 50861 / VEG) TaxID=432359 RepID=V4ZK72_TOXGV|nr:hypothetical protein TGVEG_439900 [Toxoplasma gondii VEG]
MGTKRRRTQRQKAVKPSRKLPEEPGQDCASSALRPIKTRGILDRRGESEASESATFLALRPVPRKIRAQTTGPSKQGESTRRSLKSIASTARHRERQASHQWRFGFRRQTTREDLKKRRESERRGLSEEQQRSEKEVQKRQTRAQWIQGSFCSKSQERGLQGSTMESP